MAELNYQALNKPSLLISFSDSKFYVDLGYL